jgi:hypothetical protein
MVLNDKPNCQVSRILMNPRPILSDSSENHPLERYFNKKSKLSKFSVIFLIIPFKVNKTNLIF